MPTAGLVLVYVGSLQNNRSSRKNVKNSWKLHRCTGMMGRANVGAFAIPLRH